MLGRAPEEGRAGRLEPVELRRVDVEVVAVGRLQEDAPDGHGGVFGYGAQGAQQGSGDVACSQERDATRQLSGDLGAGLGVFLKALHDVVGRDQAVVGLDFRPQGPPHRLQAAT